MPGCSGDGGGDPSPTVVRATDEQGPDARHAGALPAGPAAEAAEVLAGSFDAHASCNRTCEPGMTRATGETYVHVLELLERATRS